jgi:hypothetical protein
MADINLTQPEADALIAMQKHRTDDTRYSYPNLGGLISVPLRSPDKREQFILDVHRGRIDLLKVTHQNRARVVVVLVRLDLGGPTHRNPDGQDIPCPHLHIYREGFGDKWAVPVPGDRFSNTLDLWRALEDFMRYCNITRPPNIEKVLFV